MIRGGFASALKAAAALPERARRLQTLLYLRLSRQEKALKLTGQLSALPLSPSIVFPSRFEEVAWDAGSKPYVSPDGHLYLSAHRVQF